MQYERVKDAALYGGGYKKGRRPPPAMGGDGGLAAYAAGIAPSADGALGRWGVSLAAASGYFARCGGRPGTLSPGPLRFFEKIE